MEIQIHQLALVVQHSPDFIGVSDTAGRPVFCNAAGLRMVGISGAEMVQTHVTDYFVPEEQAFVRDVVLPSVLRDGRWAGELTFQHFKTGARIPVLYDVFRIDDPNTGQPVNFATITRDLTEQKRKNAELLDTRQKLHDLFMQAPVAICILEGPQHTFTFANPAYRALIGRDVVGKPLLEALPDVQGHGFDAVLDRVMATGEPFIGNNVPAALDRTGTGQPEESFFNVVYRPKRNAHGEVDGVMVWAFDVTENARAEAALREHRDVLALAMRGGRMGAWSRNLSTNAVWWSRELEEIFGLTPGGFEGREEGFFAFVHPDDRQAVADAVADAIRSQQDYLVEFRFRHASGEWRWMEGRGRAVYAADLHPVMLYGLGIDITERKQAEEALAVARDTAEAANRLKDQFLATLSHELRTPLNAILGYARMLRTNAIPAAKRDRAIEIIERNAVAQNQLVEDLLDIARITTGKVRLDAEPLPIARPLQEAIESVRPAAEAKRIALELDLDPFAGEVRADATRLQQVFWNLLSNAVKYTSEGGRVSVTLERKDGALRTVISDSGIGIAPEFLPYVFDPFRQADGRFSREHGGLGLGLAICKQLVDLHGGSITSASGGPGCGATFTVVLPQHASASEFGRGGDTAEPPHTASLGQTDAELTPPLQGVDVLVVDDEPDALELFRQVLENAGATVRTVAGGTDALREFDARTPDLLLTDLGLPGMDGYELLCHVRTRQPEDGGLVRAVAVTAYARLDDRTRSLAAGFSAHIAKPIDPKTLVAALIGVMSSAGCRAV